MNSKHDIRQGLLTLDGTAGGGQMLRTALSLSLVTGRAFRMSGIRGARRKPGLMRQHLACVRAAEAVSEGAVAEGAALGSTELLFRPGALRPGGEHRFVIGSAGSTLLLFQTLLPPLLMAGGTTRLRIEGGTHHPFAPPFEFISELFLPILRKMGAEVALELCESGFAPAGGGAIEARIEPCAGLRGFDLIECGAPGPLSLRVISREVAPHVSERIRDAVLAAMPGVEATIEVREPGPGQGVCALLRADSEHSREMIGQCGEFGISSERLARQLVRAMDAYLGTGAAVGRHLADQLLLPLAMAGGGRFVSVRPDEHLETNAAVIRRFLPVEIRREDLGRGRHEVVVESSGGSGGLSFPPENA